jgi:hypothetical protein
MLFQQRLNLFAEIDRPFMFDLGNRDRLGVVGCGGASEGEGG